MELLFDDFSTFRLFEKKSQLSNSSMIFYDGYKGKRIYHESLAEFIFQIYSNYLSFSTMNNSVLPNNRFLVMELNFVRIVRIQICSLTFGSITMAMETVRSGNVAKLVNRLSKDLSQLNKTTAAPSVDINFRRSEVNMPPSLPNPALKVALIR
uniref:Uncharacterized protein n=1 Tax=Onchocerca volvulus TaxID=6282 RepID=A0A8R1TMY7_ONCVO